jgi:hypothetical protein
MVRSVPRTRKRPGSKSRSAADASKRCAAIGFALAMTESTASRSAQPPSTALRAA